MKSPTTLAQSKAAYASLAILYILLVSAIAWTYPINQNDGWYASIATNFYNQVSGNQVFATWSYSVDSTETVGGGFVYSLYQLPFIFLLGPGVVYGKVVVIVTTLIVLLFAVLFFETLAPRLAVYFPALLLAWPTFWHHFNNRPEMLAVAMGLAGLYLLATGEQRSKFWVGLAFVFPFMMFDAHPISVFLVFGYYIWFFFSKRSCMPVAILGGIAGLAVYLAGNWYVHGSFGVLSGLLGLQVSRGDHYVPLFESDAQDMLRIAIQRYKLLVYYFIATFLWIPVVFHWKTFFHYIGPWRGWLISLPVFVLLSGLFSEAIGNGFPLYSSIAFCSVIFLLINFGLTSLPSGLMRAYVAIPILFLLVTLGYGELRHADKMMKLSFAAPTEYAKLEKLLPEGTRGLMRPTFAFATAKNRGYFEYTYYMLFFMKEHGLGFAEAVMQKDFDVIAIDEQDKNDMFSSGNPSNADDYWKGNNPFYSTIEGVSIDDEEFNEMVSQAVLIPFFSIDDHWYGLTQFYRVDKVRLKDFVVAHRTVQ